MYKIINIKDLTYIYSPLTQTIKEVPEEINRKLNICSTEKEKQEILQKNDLLDKELPDHFEINYPYTDNDLKHMLKHKVNSITLAATENCNLRCEYCGYMEKYLNKNYHLKNMSEEVAFRAIDFLMENSSGQCELSVSFYGGEPLLNFDLVKACVAYCHENYPFRIPQYHITTNGLLLNREDIVDYLVDNDFMVTISLDGPQERQDIFRKKVDGTPSYFEVISGLKLLYNKGGMDFFYRKVSINAVSVPGLMNKELYEFFDNMCINKITQVSLAETDYFKQLLEKLNINAGQDETLDISKYDFAYMSTINTMQKYFKAFANPVLTEKILPGGFCTPGVRKNFVTADGFLIICERVDETQPIFCLGDVWNGIDFKKVKHVLEVTKQKLESCKFCWAARFCGLCFRDILNPNKNFCAQSREDVERDIKYYLTHIVNNRLIIDYLSNLTVD